MNVRSRRPSSSLIQVVEEVKEVKVEKEVKENNKKEEAKVSSSK